MHNRCLLAILLCVAMLLGACVARKGKQASMDTDMSPTRTIQVGKLQVLALMDRVAPKSARLFPDLAQYPERKAVFEADSSPSVSRTYVVRMGKNVVLFDSGWGQADNGDTLSLLAANGIQPEHVTHIVLTHLDGDHVAGLVDAKGHTVFPTATLYVPRVEARAWLSHKKEMQPKRSRERIEQARKVLAAYKGRVRQFRSDETILPGITAIDARGHTPGHTAYELASTDMHGNRQALTIVGDLLHHAGVQLRWPSYCAVYDGDPKQAGMVREGLLARAARSGVPIAGMHFAPIGRVEALPEGGFRIEDMGNTKTE